MDKTEIYAIMCRKAGFSHCPTQDELQGMIGDYDECLDRLMGYGNMKVDRGLEYYFQFTSMEQLWLAFVMEGKYWDGSDWVGDYAPP